MSTFKQSSLSTKANINKTILAQMDRVQVTPSTVSSSAIL